MKIFANNNRSNQEPVAMGHKRKSIFGKGVTFIENIGKEHNEQDHNKKIEAIKTQP